MNCYKCATPLPDHSKFCMACGADVSGEGHMHTTMSSDADPELMAALQLELGNDYTIERELGRGGMAIVYLGQDKHLGRKVAIKLLPPMLTFGSGPGFIERFKREARTSATLDHPHIIPIYRVSTGGKLFWYVMKFLQGESVDETLKRDGKFDVDKVVHIISQAADALDYAHQSDVVHRDIKPANMMIDKKGWVTVTDFGIAKALNTGTLTGSGAAIGTPHYMSPEQCVGVGVTGASDQYALGVTAYQLLSGDLPFKADSILELMRMHAQDSPPPLEHIRQDLPNGVVEAIERAMAKESSARFESCGDFARELVRWTKDAAEGARRPTAAAGVPIKRTVPEAPRMKPVVKPRADTPAPATVAAKSPPKPRNWLVINSVVAIAIGIGAFAIYQNSQPQAPSSPRASGEVATKAPDQGDSAGAAQDSLRPSAAADTNSAAGAPAGDTKSGAGDTRPVAATSRLELHVPRGATITQNGRRVQGVADRDPTPFQFNIPLRRATAFVVSAPGYDSWRRTFTPTVSDSQLVVVSLIRTAVKAPPGPTVPVGTATLTVGSLTPASILINGKPHPDNPVRNFTVPAGRVVITFQVADSTGVWTMDTVVTLTAGENRNLRRIALQRRP